MARAARVTQITSVDENLPSRVTLDAADRRIIEMLQVDGRRAYGSIAEEVGLSETAVVFECKVTSVLPPTKSHQLMSASTSY